jgi:hypothetical protein
LDVVFPIWRINKVFRYLGSFEWLENQATFNYLSAVEFNPITHELNPKFGTLEFKGWRK